MTEEDLAFIDEQGSPKRGHSPRRRVAGKTSTASEEAFRLVYLTVSGRRAGYDLLMWQTPVLGMTAQAFLMTIALGPDTGQVSRLVASLLAFVVSVLSMQLMAKHRLHESIDAKLLVRLENEHGLADVLGIAPHAPPGVRAKLLEEGADELAGAAPSARLGRHHKLRWGWPGRQWRRSSYQIWVGGLGLFAVTDMGIVALVLIRSGALGR